MKLKRAKAYRKLMHQYEVTFGFRSPYQVLVDSELLEHAHATKIDLLARLQSVLQGPIKPMITQCCIRHLYNAKPKNDALINFAKEKLERRRCNHHELEEPLSSLECISAVVDPKGSHTNKHRYVVASQSPKVRAHMRTIAGVPNVYINKSVMIMEPMATVTEDKRDQEERSKFRAGLKGQRNPGQPPKRKRDDDEGADSDGIEEQPTEEAQPQKKKKRKGPKEPNPLSMKKAKKETSSGGNATKLKATEAKSRRPAAGEPANTATPDGEGAGPRKRRRKHKPKGDGDAAATVDGDLVAE